MHPEKVSEDWVPAALVAVVTAYAALTRPAAIRLSDLGVYLGAVDGLRHGAGLYDFISAGHAPFTYPPFAGLLFWPLIWVPTWPLQVGWTLGSLVVVWWLVRLLGRKASRAVAVPMLGLGLLLSAPVSSNLRFGQVSVLLIALVAADVLALRTTRCQGVLIGLAAAIKLTPLIFVPMLWLAGRRRAALTAAATFAGCALSAALVLPADSWRYWSTEVAHVSRLGYITSVGNQSLNGALLRLQVPAAPRIAAVLLIGGTIAAVALCRAARLGRRGDWVSALVVTGAASIVLSPVSWTHHQVWLVLAILLPVRTAWHGRTRGLWTAMVLVVMVLPVTALGPPLWSNARLLLAIVVAALVPLGKPEDAADPTGRPVRRPAQPALADDDQVGGHDRSLGRASGKPDHAGRAGL